MRLNSFTPTYPVISIVPAILCGDVGEGKDDDDNEGESGGGERVTTKAIWIIPSETEIKETWKKARVC